MSKNNPVNDVSSYFEVIEENIGELLIEYTGSEIVFRGQSKFKYDLVASLFRETRSSTFEYNQIHFLRASKFVEEEDELEIAIRAQHYGYNTRLLDVSYNCLIALYFACCDSENEDGAVFIMSVENYLPPTSIELSVLYKKLIKDGSLLDDLSVFERNPLIIETIKNNDRIIAQHGAFLLYLNNSQKISNNRMRKIKIDKEKKKTLLYQLDRFFNINHGTVFPDIQSNSLDFNTKYGTVKYSGINCEDIFDSIIEENLSDRILKKANELKDIHLSKDQLEIELRNFKRYLADSIELYFKNLSKIEKVEKEINLYSKLERVVKNEF